MKPSPALPKSLGREEIEGPEFSGREKIRKVGCHPHPAPLPSREREVYGEVLEEDMGRGAEMLYSLVVFICRATAGVTGFRFFLRGQGMQGFMKFCFSIEFFIRPAGWLRLFVTGKF